MNVEPKLYRTMFHPEGVPADRAIADLKQALDFHRQRLDDMEREVGLRDIALGSLRAELARERECRLQRGDSE